MKGFLIWGIKLTKSSPVLSDKVWLEFSVCKGDVWRSKDPLFKASGTAWCNIAKISNKATGLFNIPWSDLLKKEEKNKSVFLFVWLSWEMIKKVCWTLRW